MSAKFEFDAFLNHRGKDKPAVLPLAERLRHDGLKVRFDEWQIEPGKSLASKTGIFAALSRESS
jgi:hypothetical protein